MLFCEDVELMLQDYLDGYLLPSQREVLESHVRRCERCRELIGGLHRMDDRMDGLCEVEAPARLAHSILDALPPDLHGPSPLRRVLTWGAAPALLLLALAVGGLLQGRLSLRGALAEREVEVALSAPQASTVAVVGDFNNWNPVRTRLVRSSHEGLWLAHLRLPPGVYQYSFVIDGTTWVRAPRSKTVRADGFCGENSVIIVDG